MTVQSLTRAKPPLAKCLSKADDMIMWNKALAASNNNRSWKAKKRKQCIKYSAFRLDTAEFTYFICFTMVLFPDSPAPANKQRNMDESWEHQPSLTPRDNNIMQCNTIPHRYQWIQWLTTTSSNCLGRNHSLTLAATRTKRWQHESNMFISMSTIIFLS